MIARWSLVPVLLALMVIASGGATTAFASTDASTSEVPNPRVQPQVENGSTSNVTAGTQFTPQVSYGRTVVLDEVDIPAGGFVVIRNETAGDDPLIGVSRYLAPGSYEDVAVQLFEVPGEDFFRTRLEDDQELTALLHRDTNDDRQFDFARNEGVDGPYTRNGSAIQNPANVSVIGSAALARSPPSADVRFTPQTTAGTAVMAESTNLSAGGFIAVHRGEGSSGPIIGISRYLAPGSHRNVQVRLFDVPGQRSTRTNLGRTQNLTAVPYLDTNNNSRFDYVRTNGTVDVPYLASGSFITNPTTVRVNASSASSTTVTTTSERTTRSPTSATDTAETGPATTTEAVETTETTDTAGETEARTTSEPITSTPSPSTPSTANDGATTDGNSRDSNDTNGRTEAGGPGFGLAVVLVALLVLAGLTVRRDS